MSAYIHGDATWVYYAHLVNGCINRGHRLTWATDNSCSQNETFNKLTGGGKAHNNLPAYQNCYVWHRTAYFISFEGNFMFPSFFYGQIPKIKYKLFSYYIRLCREEGILPKMDALSQLVSQYSFGAIVMLVVTLAVAFKFLSELLEYFYNKLKKFFNYQTLKDTQHSEIVESIASLQAEIKSLSQEISNQSNDIKALQEHEKLTLERLQENSRSYIIDKHHYFCYEIKAIDDLNLESLERRYLYYKAAGGNSFIDGLMEEIRELPRINLSNPQFIVSQKNNERGE